jgi:hypothetical protein
MPRINPTIEASKRLCRDAKVLREESQSAVDHAYEVTDRSRRLVKRIKAGKEVKMR